MKNIKENNKKYESIKESRELDNESSKLIKDKYLVISASGKVWNPKVFFKEKECSKLMKVAIEREVLELPAKPDNLKDADGKAYRQVANKFGFAWEEKSKIGFLQMNYKANLMHNLVQKYARKLVNDIGFQILEVKGSNMFDMKYPVVEKYAKLFGKRLFKVGDESIGDQMVMEYDASYPQFNLASKSQLSYKNLPLAHFSISDCYRYEQRGECMLLHRSRRFFMPDLHPYFVDISAAWKGYFDIEKQLVKGFQILNRSFINIAKISSIENWEEYKEEVVQIAKQNNREILVQIKQDGLERYWIVDIDYSIIDKLGQLREIACIQIDIHNAKRLGIDYVDVNGKKKNPVIIHSAVPGGIERYLYMLIDSFCLNISEMPLIFAPVQVRLVPVNSQLVEACIELVNEFKNVLRIDIDDRNEGLGGRIKRAHESLVPNVIVVGEKELAQLNLLKNQLKELANIGNKEGVFIPLNWSPLVSKQLG